MGIARLARASALLLAAPTLACDDGTSAVEVAPMLSMVSGNGQTAFAGERLPQTLRVRVMRGAVPAVQMRVVWSVLAGDGALDPAEAVTDINGDAMTSWILGRAGNQRASATIAGQTSELIEFDAVAQASPVVLHFDGAEWTTHLGDSAAKAVRLSSVWGTSSSKVFTVGTSCGAAVIAQFNGVAWTALPAACELVSWHGADLSGRSETDVFVAMRSYYRLTWRSSVLHFDGQRWSTVFNRACTMCGRQLFGVWAGPGTKVWAVGDSGVIRLYDGSVWTEQSSGTLEVLRDVWGTSASNVFAVGTAGTILRFDGNAWSAQTSGTISQLNAVDGSSATDVFAVGANGTILRFDGTSWTAQPSGTTQSLYGLWVRAPNDVYAVGDGQTLLHYDGIQWTSKTVGTSMQFRGIWGTSPSDIFVVGSRLPS